MIVGIIPDISQIRWHVKAVLADFETLKSSPETMIEAARGELETLLEYLAAIESTNQFFAVLGQGDGNVRMNIKGSVRETNVFD